MVEVFRTNVKNRGHAKRLLNQIHKTFADYNANFDLQDCDRILRVKCTTSEIEPSCVINLLQDFGFKAEILSNDCPPANSMTLRKTEVRIFG